MPLRSTAYIAHIIESACAVGPGLNRVSRRAGINQANWARGLRGVKDTGPRRRPDGRPVRNPDWSRRGPSGALSLSVSARVRVRLNHSSWASVERSGYHVRDVRLPCGARERGCHSSGSHRPNRMTNPEVGYAFMGVEDVKFVFLDNSGCSQGLWLSSSSPGLIRRGGQDHDGVGPNPGLPVEQVFRNEEEVRRDIRNRIRGWPNN